MYDPVQGPDVQHLEPGAARKDVNLDTFTESVLQSKSPENVYWKAMGPDFACSQATLTCVMEPTSMLIPSRVTSPGRDNFNGLPMNLVESLVQMGTGKQPAPSDPVRPNQSIPEHTPDDSCFQEVYYSLRVLFRSRWLVPVLLR